MIEEARRVLQLSWPMIVAQLGHMTMAVVDAIVVGHTGTESLAAMALGHIWISGTLMIANGIVMGVDPGDQPDLRRGRRSGRRARIPAGHRLRGGAVRTPTLLWLVTEPVLQLFGKIAKLSHEAAVFVAVQAPSAVFFLMFSVLRQYLGGRGLGRTIAVVVLAGNVVNALLCWALVFGKLGFPAMGLVGSGNFQRPRARVPRRRARGRDVRTRSHSWSVGALEPQRLRPARARADRRAGRSAWRPIWIGSMGFPDLGAPRRSARGRRSRRQYDRTQPRRDELHGAPRLVDGGIHSSRSTIGAGDPLAARKSSVVSLALAAAFMSLAAVTFLVFRNELPHLYGATPAVASLAATVFPIAAAFQLFDGAQVVGGGVLRGMGRTRPAAILNLGGYYVVALPLGYLLAFTWGGGLRGLWAGVAIGLFLVAAGLLPLTVRKSAFQGLRRVAT